MSIEEIEKGSRKDADHIWLIQKVKELQEGITTFIDWTTSPQGCELIKDIPDEIWRPFNKLIEEGGEIESPNGRR